MWNPTPQMLKGHNLYSFWEIETRSFVILRGYFFLQVKVHTKVYMHPWLSISKVSKLHNKQTHKRRIAKCSCCNKRLTKVVTYECWTEDCDDHVLHGNVAKEDRLLWTED